MNEKKVKVGFVWILFGLWLIAFSWTFQSASEFMHVSDLVSGIFLIGLGFSAMQSKCERPLWEGAAIGLWLQLAPILSWCPEALFYINDTLVGALLIVLAFVGATSEEKGKGAIPSGWSYNPSSWKHRIPTVVLAVLSWFFARYMAAYQLGYIHEIWDPFFGEGTLKVITSNISKSFPISDAGMGAICYTLEALLGWQGDEERWHKMPWLVIAFGFLVVPVGIISILLIILQPVAVGFWCGWCLMTAICMLLMIVLTAGELVASLQYLKRSLSKRKCLWELFWKGSQGNREHILGSTSSKSKGWGCTLAWNLVVLIAIGVWLMISPSYFGASDNVLATGNYIEGPLIIALAVLSMAEVLRPLRFCHILLGAGLILTAIFHPEPISSPNWNNYGMGILTILLAIPRGKIEESYGSWNRMIL